MQDQNYMELAISLAKKGAGYVNPNPMVGAVIVKNNRIISQGYHTSYGSYHAERQAILASPEPLYGSTLYVTLEPCCHHGKTPPCTDLIIEHGITHVVIGTLDPNPKISGKGAEQLRRNGINVIIGVLEEKCKKLIQAFSHYITTKTPYVILKYAMTMDGKIATHTRQAKWITGEKARHHVHQIRHNISGILVGSRTIKEDDPLLTCRLEHGKNPTRIICDTHLTIPLSSQVVQTAYKIPTIIATCEEKYEKHLPYLNRGCNILSFSNEYQQVPFPLLMKKLGEIYQIDSLLIEGGSTIHWSALKEGIVNKVLCYIAPKLFGGINAPSPVGGLGISSIQEYFQLSPPEITRLGEDILLESEVIS